MVSSGWWAFVRSLSGRLGLSRAGGGRFRAGCFVVTGVMVAVGASVGVASAQTSGLKAAQAAFAQFTTPAVNAAPATKLLATPPRGKKIICIQNPQGGNSLVLRCDAAVSAGKLLGWHVQPLNEDGSVTDIQAAMNQALQLHPAGIINEDATPLSEVAQQITQARKEKIPVVWNSAALPNETIHGAGKLPFPIVGGHGGTYSQNRDAESVASFVAVNSSCHVHVALATIESIAALKSVDTYFINNLKRFCPSAKVTIVNNAITDVGQTMNNRVVAAVQADPSINYIYTDASSFIQGLQPALQAAGIGQGIKIVGLNPQPTDYPLVKAGKESAWCGGDTTLYGWYDIDSLARYYTNSPLVTEVQAPDPTFCLDKQTLDKEAGEKNVDIANGLSTTAIIDQFKDDWHV